MIDSPNAFAIANISRIATKGMVNRLDPKLATMPLNGTSVPLCVVENGGTMKRGNPAATSPVILKGIWSHDCWMMNAAKVPIRTTIAFRERATYLLKI